MKNIYFLSNTNKYMVKIKGHYLGLYNSLEDAQKALTDWKNAYPKETKKRVNVTLTKKQFSIFKKLGSQKWLKNYLNDLED